MHCSISCSRLRRERTLARNGTRASEADVDHRENVFSGLPGYYCGRRLTPSAGIWKSTNDASYIVVIHGGKLLSNTCERMLLIAPEQRRDRYELSMPIGDGGNSAARVGHNGPEPS